MSTQPRPAVFDCNVYLQAMLSSRGAANACWQRVLGGEVTVFVSSFILTEIRRLPQHRSLRRFSQFTQERVERFIEELLDVAIVATDPAPVFAYDRDPDDAHYVNLAIATGGDARCLERSGPAGPDERYESGRTNAPQAIPVVTHPHTRRVSPEPLSAGRPASAPKTPAPH